LKAPKKYLIVIAGPTAVGKTAAAIQVAQQLETEIISADSRQFYKELYIGVAKPSPEELMAVPHHFVGHISIDKSYTAADYEHDALLQIKTLFKTHNCVVLTGGSGLFINAVLNGLDDLPSDETIRTQLGEQLATNGLAPLAAQLQQLDEETYNSIDINNHRRVVRALEICLASGKKASELRLHKNTKRNFTPIKIALNTDRELLYKRINHRVDVMLETGLINEVQELMPFRHLNSLQTVGYKELFCFFDRTCTLPDAIELIKQHTRNYAKRQITWFRKDESYKWFAPDAIENILAYIGQQMV
jgi:tRNA dimethylallyltransferase